MLAGEGERRPEEERGSSTRNGVRSPTGHGRGRQARRHLSRAKVSGGDSGGSPQDFSDASGAVDTLKPLGDPTNPIVKYVSGHADEYQMSPVQKTLGSVLDLGSPSAMAVEASKLLFDLDPFAEVTNWVFGDWNKYNDCSDVWGNLASF